jgi:hypothetical protein
MNTCLPGFDKIDTDNSLYTQHSGKRLYTHKYLILMAIKLMDFGNGVYVCFMNR